MPIKFPLLRIDNLILRQIVAADISNIYKGLSDPIVIEYYGVSYKSLAETEAQMDWFSSLEKNENGIWWAITGVNDQLFYGAIGLNNLTKPHKKAEIGFWLLPDYWGKGIMNKALTTVCNYAFKVLNLHRIEAFVETGNISSKKILIKSNFSHEGTMVDCEIKNENYISLECYAKIHQQS
ncbi:MAG: N-acetyltransferase [Pedobacter sp.]|nr:MAG: N-acetyltransferase [Pedobacter sp.]